MALNAGQGQAVGGVSDAAYDTRYARKHSAGGWRMAAVKGGWAHRRGGMRQSAGMASSRRLRQFVVDNQPN